MFGGSVPIPSQAIGPWHAVMGWRCTKSEAWPLLVEVAAMLRPPAPLPAAAVQDEWEQTADHVCLLACECPADGSPCQLSDQCRHRVELKAPRARGHSFLSFLLGILMGGAGLAAYLHTYGVPVWFPLQGRGFGAPSLGLYQELNET